MKELYATKVRIEIDANNGELEDFPRKTKYCVEFDATDLTMTGWVQEFKKVLYLYGFTEQTIEDYFGAE